MAAQPTANHRMKRIDTDQSYYHMHMVQPTAGNNSRLMYVSLHTSTRSGFFPWLEILPSACVMGLHTFIVDPTPLYPVPYSLYKS